MEEVVGTGVHRVDRHLAVGRPGDLHPPLLERRRSRRDLPVALPDRARLLKEPEVSAAPRYPRPQQHLANSAEATLQLLDKGQRVCGEDLVEARLERPADLDHGTIQTSGLALTTASADTTSPMRTLHPMTWQDASPGLG